MNASSNKVMSESISRSHCQSKELSLQQQHHHGASIQIQTAIELNRSMNDVKQFHMLTWFDDM